MRTFNITHIIPTNIILIIAILIIFMVLCSKTKRWLPYTILILLLCISFFNVSSAVYCYIYTVLIFLGIILLFATFNISITLINFIPFTVNKLVENRNIEYNKRTQKPFEFITQPDRSYHKIWNTIYLFHITVGFLIWKIIDHIPRIAIQSKIQSKILHKLYNKIHINKLHYELNL